MDNNLDLDNDDDDDDGDDTELLEDDILVGDSNDIPSIIFSERVQHLAIKSMDLALVVKVVGRRLQDIFSEEPTPSGGPPNHTRWYCICSGAVEGFNTDEPLWPLDARGEAETVHCIGENTSSLDTFVYASPHSSKRKHLWSYLRQLSPHISEPWAIIGDFNDTLSSDEHMGCASSSKHDSDFLSTLFDIGFRDLGYYGSPFTWYRANCVVRLDRYLCNSHWFEAFLDTRSPFAMYEIGPQAPLCYNWSFSTAE
ncbi:hypothetical protein V6N13_055003 [Hibiscus sabdariffa]